MIRILLLLLLLTHSAWAQPLRIIGGGANGGCLTGAVGLPAQGDGFQTIHAGNSHFYGAPSTIQGVMTLARRAREQGLPPLLIEDISRPRGGPTQGVHAAHQTGLDVDIATDMRGRGYLSPDQAASIQIATLVRPDQRGVIPGMFNEGVVRLLWIAATLPGVDRVLVNPAIKKALCETVGGDRSWLRLIRPFYGHAAHMHVSFKCPAGQPECFQRPPPPPGDGCDASLQWWFDRLDHPEPVIHGPPKPKLRLPEACYAILGIPG